MTCDSLQHNNYTHPLPSQPSKGTNCVRELTKPRIENIYPPENQHSPLHGIFEDDFPFRSRDVLVPWRVSMSEYHMFSASKQQPGLAFAAHWMRISLYMSLSLKSKFGKFTGTCAKQTATQSMINIAFIRLGNIPSCQATLSLSPFCNGRHTRVVLDPCLSSAKI